ncbi:conserved hypothetical protein [uncultured Sporomusa sp.]|uniref:Uncharacterized protein n=1 Tax=uncultured Sporomusa sp. TaxID=307249 RepID=A0A212LPC6_9FIRM|nr:conserved hypothetical protein [uncultured Sporomusa sp.]
MNILFERGILWVILKIKLNDTVVQNVKNTVTLLFHGKLVKVVEHTALFLAQQEQQVQQEPREQQEPQEQQVQQEP